MTEVKKNSSGTVPAKEETEMEEESKAGLLEPGTKYAIANLKGKPMLFRHGWPMRDVGYDGNWEDHWYDDYGMYRPDEVWNVRAKDATLFDEEELEELETFLGQLWYPQSEGFWSLAMLAPESEVFLVPEGLVKSLASRNRTTAKDFERVKKEGVRLSAYLLRKWYGLNRA